MYYDPIDDVYYEEYDVALDERYRYAMLSRNLVEELKEQTLEILALRRLLCKYMNLESRTNIEYELFNDIYPEILYSSEYSYFVEHICNGNDPFNEDDYCQKEEVISKGKHIYNHPNINISLLRK